MAESSKSHEDQQRKTGGQQGQAGGQRQKGQDPNREPGDQDLYNEDAQGDVFYDKNTEIKRESEFHDSTGAPIGNAPKVTPENDEFGKEKKRKS